MQLYTALVFEGPGLIARIKRELAELLAADGYDNLSRAVGVAAGNRLERARVERVDSHGAPMTVPIFEGVSSFASRYDAMILDLWGLIHDGVAPYPAFGLPGSSSRRGTRVLLLSNAPRPSGDVVGRLREMGIRDDRYERVITSGDITRDALTRRDDDWHAALGERCWLIGPERDWGLVEGLDLALVDDMEGADFMLATGLFDDETEGLADYADRLERRWRGPLPMVCANPDLSSCGATGRCRAPALSPRPTRNEGGMCATTANRTCRRTSSASRC